jgi:predicted small secreted protein
MIELSTLQAVREVVTIVGVVAGLTYYVLTVQNANKARKIQLINRSAQYGQNMELSIITLKLLEIHREDNKTRLYRGSR